MIRCLRRALSSLWSVPVCLHGRAAGLVVLGILLSGCQQGGPHVPVDEASLVVAAPERRLSDGQEAIVALFEVTVDGSSMQGTATVLPLRSSSQGELFDLDIAPFRNRESLQIVGLERTADDNLEVAFTHAHPFPAASDLGGAPNGFSNRADLGYTGRLLLLAQDQVQSFFNGEVRLDPTLVVNSDGYLQADALLASPIANVDTFPFVLLADELKDNRVGITNNGNPMGNYDLDGRGWDESNIVGPGGKNNGWTGFDFVHQGQTIWNTFTLSGAAIAANSNSYTLEAALVIQYTDPRGPGTPPSATTRKSNRLPRAGGTALDFAYRLPHAALDIAKISEPEPMEVVALTDRCDAGIVDLRDWDRLATATVANGTDLQNQPEVGTIALAGDFSETSMPFVEFSVPTGLFTNTEFTKIGGAEQKLGQEAIFTGERYGLPGSELQYQIIAGYAAGSTLVPGSYYGLVRITDNEQRNDADSGYHFGYPSGSPGDALEATYQIVQIEVTVPPTPDFGPPSIYSSPCDDGGETFGTDTWSVGTLNVPPLGANYVWNFGGGATILSPGGPNQLMPQVVYDGAPGIYEGSVTVSNPQGSATQEFTYQIDPPNETYNPTTNGPLVVEVDGPRPWVAAQEVGALNVGIPYHRASAPDRRAEIRFNWNDDTDFGDTGEAWQLITGELPIIFQSPLAYDNLTNVPEMRTLPYEIRDDGVTSPGTPGSADFRLNAGEPGGGFATNFNMENGGTSHVISSTFPVSNHSLAVDSDGNFYVGGEFDGTVALGIRTLSIPATAAAGFVAKFDPEGNPIWGRSFIATGTGAALSVTEVEVDIAGNVLVAGGFIGTATFNNGATNHTKAAPDENVWALKLQGFNGVNTWADAYVVTSPVGRVLLHDTTLMRPVDSSHLLLAGGFSGQANFGGGLRTAAGATLDGYIVRINNSTGAYITDRVVADNAVFGTPGDQIVHALDVDAAGFLHFAAGYNREVDWCNGGSPCGGSPYTAPIGRYHMVLGQVNLANTPTLGRMYPVTGAILPYSVVVDDAAGGINGGIAEVWITGSHDAATVAGIGAGVAGQLTPFLIAVTPSYTNVFQRTFPGAVANTSASGFMAITPSQSADKIFVSGRFDNATNFGSGVRTPVGTGDGYVIAYERSSGAPAWEQLLSSTGVDTRMGGIAVDPNGWVGVIGQMDGNTTVNQSLGRVLPKSVGAGSTEAFLVLYKPDGSW